MKFADPDIQKLDKILFKHNAYLTKPRKLVFEFLRDHPHPAQTGYVIKALKPQIHRVSVYRTLDLLEKVGVIKRISVAYKDRYELSEIFSKHHHHLFCENCGQITPIIEDYELEELLANIGETYKFKITDHDIELRGLCQNCQKNP